MAAAIKPYSEEPWLYLGLVFRKQGNLAASQDAANKVLELCARKLEVNPNDGITLSRMAATYAGMGKKEKALDVLKRVLKIDPEDGLALYNCACTYSLLEKRKEALTYLKSALKSGYGNILEWVKSDPDFDLIREDPKFKEILSKYGE